VSAPDEAPVDLTAPGDVRPPAPAELVDDPRFPFTGDVRVKALVDPVVPEPARNGAGGADCRQCSQPDSVYVWTDEHWRLRGYRPTPYLGVVLLEARAHLDSFLDLPPARLAELGPLTARIERALLGLGGFGRVHVYRWGDGGEHFHLWFMPRPLGALQLRGTMLPVWMDVMPAQPDVAVDETLARLSAALQEG
jgi:diadenosine tetraphosphate (Ap4A) HIT family hydrolase